MRAELRRYCHAQRQHAYRFPCFGPGPQGEHEDHEQDIQRIDIAIECMPGKGCWQRSGWGKLALVSPRPTSKQCHVRHMKCAGSKLKFYLGHSAATRPTLQAAASMSLRSSRARTAQPTGSGIVKAGRPWPLA